MPEHIEPGTQAHCPANQQESRDEVAFATSSLQQEAHALTLMAQGLTPAFCEVVDGLYGIRGRIAVTGMGKSGHVARKVAATLASTGSPAYFIHPAEASHGDLGMLTSRDAVIAFSSSGNTSELQDIVQYAARRGLPLVAITRNAGSMLARHATHHCFCPLCRKLFMVEIGKFGLVFSGIVTQNISYLGE